MYMILVDEQEPVLLSTDSNGKDVILSDDLNLIFNKAKEMREIFPAHKYVVYQLEEV